MPQNGMLGLEAMTTGCAIGAKGDNSSTTGCGGRVREPDSSSTKTRSIMGTHKTGSGRHNFLETRGAVL